MYIPDENNSKDMIYNRCGNSGLKLPALSLDLWHNLGDNNSFDNGRALIR